MAIEDEIVLHKQIMKQNKLSAHIVEQRVRNRIIELLSSIVSFGEASGNNDLNEILNQWEDWVGTDHPIDRTGFTEPVYTSAEYDALLAVDIAWQQLCDVTQQTITHADGITHLPEWGSYVAAASIAASVLGQRGRMPEEQEE